MPASSAAVACDRRVAGPLNAKGTATQGKSDARCGMLTLFRFAVNYWQVAKVTTVIGFRVRRLGLFRPKWATQAERSQSGCLHGGEAISALFVAQLAPLRQARPRRNQLADDDVLLQAAQVIGQAVDGRLGQHARRLLERSRRQEAIRVQR